MLDIETLAIRFVTEGDDKVKGALDAVRKGANDAANVVESGMKKADEQMGKLAKATQNVGNQLGLGLRGGMIAAGKGIAEVATGVEAYVRSQIAAAGATTLLARAQVVATATSRALGAAMAAVGGPVGLALIAALLTLDKITGGLEKKNKALEDSYQAVYEATQKQYEQMVAGEVAWLNAGRSITDAAVQLDAYRRGGERALEVTRQEQAALAQARAQWEAVPGNLKQASDAAYLAIPAFQALYAAALKAAQIQRQITDAMAGKKVVDDAKKGDVEMRQALYNQQQLNVKAMQDRLTTQQEGKEREKQVLQKFDTEKTAAEALEYQRGLDAFEAYGAETDRMLEEAFVRRQEIIAQQAAELAGGIANAIDGAFRSAFSGGGVGGAIAAFGAGILAAFGSILVRMGTAALAAAPFIEAIRSSLMTLSGASLIGGGLALIAVGSALGAVASQIGGAGFSGGSSGGGYSPSAPLGTSNTIVFGQNSATTAAGNTPRTPINVTVIGPNDPTAQRQITELVRNAERRSA